MRLYCDCVEGLTHPPTEFVQQLELIYDKKGREIYQCKMCGRKVKVGYDKVTICKQPLILDINPNDKVRRITKDGNFRFLDKWKKDLSDPKKIIFRNLGETDDEFRKRILNVGKSKGTHSDRFP